MLDAVLVDDDPHQLGGLAELVAREGFATRTADSLAAARALFAVRKPDVVLSDLVLPDGEGTELLAYLGGTPRLVLVTGHASVESAVEALRKGVFDYLLKPVDTERLHELLERVTRSIESDL